MQKIIYTRPLLRAINGVHRAACSSGSGASASIPFAISGYECSPGGDVLGIVAAEAVLHLASDPANNPCHSGSGDASPGYSYIKDDLPITVPWGF